MARRRDPKEEALEAARCLNPHPEQVTDPEFLSSDFFDARDAVQVRYEMVRKVEAGGAAVTEAAAAFGYSRPAYYAAAAALESAGLEGLVPARPGPRGASKLTDEICAWAEQQLAAGPGAAPGTAGRPGRGGIRGARAPPQHRASAGPLPGAPLQKPLTCPPPEERRAPRPCPCSHHLATRLLNRADARMPARPPFPAAGWTPATSSSAMPPCTRAARRSASASACSQAKASSPGSAPWPPSSRPPAQPPPLSRRRPAQRSRYPPAWTPSLSAPWPHWPSPPPYPRTRQGAAHDRRRAVQGNRRAPVPASAVVCPPVHR